MRPTVLQGKGIRFTRVMRTDIPEMALHFQNLQTTTYLHGYGRTFTLQDEYSWFDGTENNPGQITFGILTESDELIGTCALFNLNQRDGTGTFGICIYKPEHWGQGHGTEATRLMVQYGMYHLNLFNIDLQVFAFNERAIRAYQKVGFREVGRRTGAVVLGGERFDKVWMEITRDEVDLTPMQEMLPLLQSGPWH